MPSTYYLILPPQIIMIIENQMDLEQACAGDL